MGVRKILEPPDQPPLYHRRLAHPGFSTDKNELTASWAARWNHNSKVSTSPVVW